LHGISQRLSSHLFQPVIMGIKSYFKAEKPKPTKGKATQPETIEEKTGAPGTALPPSNSNGPELLRPRASTQRNSYGPLSISDRSSRSAAGSSLMLEDIRHEVMVNYLFQQQCSNLWVGDGSGETEGVLLRKSRGQYMACPPELSISKLANSCAALNVHVSVQVQASNCFSFRQDKQWGEKS